MKRELIPVILAKNFSDFKERLTTIKTFKPKPLWIQIDVVDGKFAPWKTWADPEIAKHELRGMNYEVDLMVVDPLKHAKAWMRAGAKRILFHIEHNVKDQPSTVIACVKKNGAEVGASLNARTSLRNLFPYLASLDCVLLLGVNPGRSGQPFQPSVLKKIRTLRKKFPHLPIEVDGGVSLKNAQAILRAGATRLATASALHKAANPQQTYKNFLKVIKK
ncbi:thiamine phosphate synthase [Candidatus Uhrbacteria bacterium]|nr:thiamine phosphate synthase [Candidatus Uhrbacteria bacterium]